MYSSSCVRMLRDNVLPECQLRTYHLATKRYIALRFTNIEDWNPVAFGAQVFKHRHQEVITKVDETVTWKFIYGQAEVL